MGRSSGGGRSGRGLARAAAAVLLSAVPLAGQERDARDTLKVVAVAPLTVTVLRGPVDAGREPYPVASLGEDALRQGKTGAFLEEALDGLPGVQVQNRFNYAVGERISIRGFGPRAQFGVRGIRMLVDGIPATFPDGQSALDHVDLGSLGRVEVLRGPGSSLYGNAAGGVLTFESRRPAPESFHQEVRATGGSHGLLNLQALGTGTAGATGYLVSAARLGYHGYRTDPTGERETYGRARRWNANAHLRRPVGTGVLSLVLNAADLDAENPGSLSEALLDEQGPIAFANNVRQRTGKEVSQGQLGGAWTGPLGDLDGELAAWGITRDVRNPIPGTIVDLDRLAGGARALFRGGAGSGPRALSWGAGAEIELQRDDRRNFANASGEEGALTLDQLEHVLATGAFVQGRLSPVRRVEVSAALRYDRFRFEARDRFVGAGDPDDSGERVMDALSPSLGVFVEVARPLGLYASVATALETPTTTELTNRPDGGGGFNPDLEAQRGVTWEAGLRGRVGERIGYELTAFRTEVDDELVPFEVPEQQGRTFFRNAGSSVHEGVEAALRAVLTRSLSAQLAWSHVDARFESYQVDGEDFSGNPVPGLAPHRLEGLLRAEGGRWFADVEGEWVDEVPVSDAGDARAPSYALLDVRAGLDRVQAAGLALSPFAGVSNVLDEEYVASVVVNAFGSRYFEPGPGRTFHVGLTASWTRR